jgi:hypothetical protein
MEAAGDDCLYTRGRGKRHRLVLRGGYRAVDVGLKSISSLVGELTSRVALVRRRLVGRGTVARGRRRRVALLWRIPLLWWIPLLRRVSARRRMPGMPLRVCRLGRIPLRRISLLRRITLLGRIAVPLRRVLSLAVAGAGVTGHDMRGILVRRVASRGGGCGGRRRARERVRMWFREGQRPGCKIWQEETPSL